MKFLHSAELRALTTQLISAELRALTTLVAIQLLRKCRFRCVDGYANTPTMDAHAIHVLEPM